MWPDLHDEQVVLLGKRENWVHVYRMTVHVGKNDGSRPYRDSRLERLGARIRYFLIDVTEYRGRPQESRDFGVSDVDVRGNQHLVVSPDAKRHRSNQKRGGSRVYAHNMIGAQKRCELSLKPIRLLAAIVDGVF